MTTLWGTQIVFTYEDETEVMIPVIQTLSETRDLIQRMLDDSSFDGYLHFSVAGEDVESWVSLSGLRTIDAKKWDAAELNTTDTPRSPMKKRSTAK